jgi:CheY-like chemotaxis protein
MIPSNLTLHAELTILLAEDDPGHAALIAKNLRRARIANPIVTVADGQAAVDYLFGREADPVIGQPPILVLLDLNMPVLDGYQVLARLRADERTRHIPVVVLTSTDDPREVNRCYELGCNVYVTKPVDYERFAEAIQKLGLFLAVVALPNRSEASCPTTLSASS